MSALIKAGCIGVGGGIVTLYCILMLADALMTGFSVTNPKGSFLFAFSVCVNCAIIYCVAHICQNENLDNRATA